MLRVIPWIAVAVALSSGATAPGGVLPDCKIDFELLCPDAAPVCGSLFSGGNSCLFEGLCFCYSSGLFSYKITPASPLTITLSGDLNGLELFFSHQGAAAGEMRFFDAVVGGNEVDGPLTTNGDCLAFMPPMQCLTFSTPVRRIEVTASGGAFTAVWIDDFHVNPTPVQDCNNNEVPDATDIANGTSPDCNANMIPDECEFPGCPGILPADMNCDGNTDGKDVQRFVETIVPGGYTCQADMNQDGALDETDVTMFVGALLGI